MLTSIGDHTRWRDEISCRSRSASVDDAGARVGPERPVDVRLCLPTGWVCCWPGTHCCDCSFVGANLGARCGQAVYVPPNVSRGLGSAFARACSRYFVHGHQSKSPKYRGGNERPASYCLHAASGGKRFHPRLQGALLVAARQISGTLNDPTVLEMPISCHRYVAFLSFHVYSDIAVSTIVSSVMTNY